MMNQPDPMSHLREILVGEWDAYSPGMSSQLLLQAGGQYQNTLAGGMQYHWGQWSLIQNGGAPILHFLLAGAEPQYYVGPLGSVKIQWPREEHWMITGVQHDRIDFYGVTIVRRVIAPPPLPQPASGMHAPWRPPSIFPLPAAAPPAQPHVPPPPATSPQVSVPTPNQEVLKKIRESNEEIMKTMQQMHENTKKAYEQANKAWSDYFKS
jgi:hypothetical protein